jgi:hypothetical protein
MRLLAAVAAVALPAAIAGAQGTQHVPLGQPAPPPSHRTPRTTHATPTPAPTANTATEDQQTTTPAADAPATVNRNAEPGTRTDAASDATTQAATQASRPPTGLPAPAAQAQATTPPAAAAPAAQAQAGTQTPPAGQAAPAAQAQAGAQAQGAAPAAAAVPVRAATAADLHSGLQVRDQSGGVVGTVESADASGAVVSTGSVRARLPLTSFGTNGQNLVISLSKTELEAAAGHAQAQPSAG